MFGLVSQYKSSHLTWVHVGGILGVDRALRLRLRLCSPDLIPPPTSASSCLIALLLHPRAALPSYPSPDCVCGQNGEDPAAVSPPAFHQPPASTLGSTPRSIPLISVRIHTGDKP
ncbi:hypothetical protein K438DRAFT_1971887 [Mycena galopus ATCC 62051]|nr:hypothetical protein K438DRAFT_1971887 [Mycena galopus ATCC 62051]